MQSSNPIFTRAAGFNGRDARSSAGARQSVISDPSTWSVGSPGDANTSTGRPTQVDQAPMSLDSVVQKTGMTLGLAVLAAAVTWVLTGDPAADQGTASTLYTLSIGGALIGFVLAMVNSFKKVVSPPLVLAYAAVEGVFIGAMSKVFQGVFGDGVVTGAVLGTIAAVGGTLAAYKFFNIQVGTKFRKFTVAAMFGFVAITMLDFVLGLFGNAIGFNGFGGLGLIMSFVGLGIGILMLILDFDFVERGIAARLPEVESWRAAFGLTVTIIWIYIEILRILAIFSDN